MIKLKIIVTALFLMVVTSITEAQTFKTQNGHAEFHAQANLNDYTGVSNHLEGEVDFDSKSVYFKLPIKSLDTHNGKRNRDMYKLMQVDQYPFAEFKGNLISHFNPDSEKPQHVTVSGNFTLHGVQKPLKVTGLINRNGKDLHLEVNWDLYITHYNIKPPKILFNKVKDKHIIKVTADLQEQKQGGVGKK